MPTYIFVPDRPGFTLYHHTIGTEAADSSLPEQEFIKSLIHLVLFAKVRSGEGVMSLENSI